MDAPKEFEAFVARMETADQALELLRMVNELGKTVSPYNRFTDCRKWLLQAVLATFRDDVDGGFVRNLIARALQELKMETDFSKLIKQL